MRFVAEHCDYDFVGVGGGINQPATSSDNVDRLNHAAEKPAAKSAPIAC